MDFFFCIPIIFGCPTKVTPDNGQTLRICPRCHNGAVVSAKSRRWFELCWVPLVPMNSKHVWMCTICQWNVPIQQNWEPQVASSQGPQNFWQQGPRSPYEGPGAPPGGFQPGYQPAYVGQH